jgi:hypothetical protein
VTLRACSCGSLHPAGSSCPNYRKPSGRNGSTRAWRGIRESVLRRDRYACVVCGDTANLEVDHIDGDFRNNDPANLRTVCFEHNPRGPVFSEAPRTPPHTSNLESFH